MTETMIGRPKFNERQLRLLLMAVVVYRRDHEPDDAELRRLEAQLRRAVDEPAHTDALAGFLR